MISLFKGAVVAKWSASPCRCENCDFLSFEFFVHNLIVTGLNGALNMINPAAIVVNNIFTKLKLKLNDIFRK